MREPRLNQVVARENGVDVTVRDRILDWLRAGIPYDTSVLRSGIGLTRVHEMLREAAKAEELAMTNPTAKLSAWQRDLVVFSRQIEHAKAEGEAKFHELMGSLAVGGLAETTVTVKMVEDANAPGGWRTVERSSKTTRTLPHYAAVKWILENRYGRRVPTELVWHDTLTGALSDSEGVDALIEGAEAYLAQRAEQRGNGSTNGHT